MQSGFDEDVVVQWGVTRCKPCQQCIVFCVGFQFLFINTQAKCCKQDLILNNSGVKEVLGKCNAIACQNLTHIVTTLEASAFGACKKDKSVYWHFPCMINS